MAMSLPHIFFFFSSKNENGKKPKSARRKAEAWCIIFLPLCIQRNPNSYGQEYTSLDNTCCSFQHILAKGLKFVLAYKLPQRHLGLLTRATATTCAYRVVQAGKAFECTFWKYAGPPQGLKATTESANHVPYPTTWLKGYMSKIFLLSPNTATC